MAMDNLALLTNMFAGGPELYFRAAPDSLNLKHFYLIGQMCALAIVYVSRGPQCFAPCIVDELFGVCEPDLPSSDSIQDGYFIQTLNEICNGNNDYFLAVNVAPRSTIRENEEMFVRYTLLLSVAGEIAQFLRGFESVCGDLEGKRCCLRRFFLKSDPQSITFADLINHIKFVLPDHDEGSNDAELLDICEGNVRIWFQELQYEVEGITLVDLIKALTGFDRIPLTGFGKQCEIHLELPMTLGVSPATPSISFV